jgi:hypothetical protein
MSWYLHNRTYPFGITYKKNWLQMGDWKEALARQMCHGNKHLNQMIWLAEWQATPRHNCPIYLIPCE